MVGHVVFIGAMRNACVLVRGREGKRPFRSGSFFKGNIKMDIK
jgi:hypothetical protein